MWCCRQLSYFELDAFIFEKIPQRHDCVGNGERWSFFTQSLPNVLSDK